MEWIVPAVIRAITNTVVAVATPSLNTHVVGAGVIQWFFLVASVFTFIGSLLTGSNVMETPSVWVLLSGLLYGAGALSIQKATERAPDPGVSLAIPSSRAFLTALLALIILRISPLPKSLLWIYLVQVILSICLVLFIHTTFPKSSNETPEWFSFSIIAAGLMSLADVILKYSGTHTRVIQSLLWFTVTGAVVATLFNWKQTGSILPSFRYTTTEKLAWWKEFAGISVVFLIGIIAQFLSITYSPNPAYPTMITSIAIPLTAIVSRWIHHQKTSILEILLLTGLATTTALAGWMTSSS